MIHLAEDPIELIKGVIQANREDTLSDYRKAEISRLVTDLKKGSDEMNLEQIFQDLGINVFVDDMVIEPTCDGGRIVLLPTYGTEAFRRFYTAHELGHTQLHFNGHPGWISSKQKEQEANYFAKNLVGRPPLKEIRSQALRRINSFQFEPLKGLKGEYEAHPGRYVLDIEFSVAPGFR